MFTWHHCFAEGEVRSLHVRVLSPIWDFALEPVISLLKTDILPAYPRIRFRRAPSARSRPVWIGSLSLVHRSRNVCGRACVACERRNNARPLLKVGNSIAWHEHDVTGCNDG